MMNALDDKSEHTAPGGEDDSASSSALSWELPVAAKRNSVITYYGIDRHDNGSSRRSSADHHLILQHDHSR